MFKADQCKLCGLCLTQCQWMTVTTEKAVQWRKEMTAGKRTPVLDNCITCFSCNEICPNGADPCDQNLELQEKYRTLVPEAVVKAFEKNDLFEGEVTNVPKADRILSACSYEKTDPGLLQGDIYDLPRVGGKPYLCWAAFPHMGALSIQRQQLQTLVQRLAMTRAKEVVCFHADCYSALAKTAPEAGIHIPFKPIHLADYLVEYLLRHVDRVKPLNMAIAYQRPCTSRHTPEKEAVIDAFFELVGVRRVERKYDRKQALCCTSVKLMHNKGDGKLERQKNVSDAKNAGAELMVYFCPVCRTLLAEAAGENGLPLVFLGDLARAAIGEIRLPG